MPRIQSGTRLRYLARYTKKNNVEIALGAIFVLGVVAGCFICAGAGDETLTFIEAMLDSMINSRRDGTLSENFSAAFSSSVIFAGILFFCGFCAIAQPVITAAPFIRGLGFGLTSATLYMNYGGPAIGYVSLFLMPGMLISTTALLVCASAALKLSGYFFGAMLLKPGGGEGYGVKGYCAKFALCAVICALAALLEAGLYIMFANSFVLG
jgi:hypothetical protein